MGFEAVYKTAPVDGFGMKINTSSLSSKRTKNTPATLSGTRNPAEPFDGNLEVGGNLVIPVDSLAFWYWLKAIFGAPATSGAATPWTHEFKIGTAMPSLGIEFQYTDLATAKYDLFSGCKASTFGMEVGGDGELVANLGIIGALEAMNSASFDGTPANPGFNRLANFQAALTEGGAALANATSFSFNIDLGLDPQRVIGGQGTLGEIPEAIVKVTGNLKTLFQDVSLLTKALNSTETGLKLTVTRTASAILEMEIQELQYEQKSPEVSGPGGILVDLNFSGYFTDGSAASAIVARLTNTAEHAGGV
jgi:hypothetical protein